ncbi:MAG: hypothetical protein HYU75_02220 [Betaproteobacteria bacterium]|nr:hypothetical protein [Betaproteobacteria bacterium]
MYRANLIASLIAVALFAYAQARGIDPLSFLDGDRTPQSSAKERTQHK